jgi:hypothetical protein
VLSVKKRITGEVEDPSARHRIGGNGGDIEEGVGTPLGQHRSSLSLNNHHDRSRWMVRVFLQEGDHAVVFQVITQRGNIFSGHAPGETHRNPQYPQPGRGISSRATNINVNV